MQGGRVGRVLVAKINRDGGEIGSWVEFKRRQSYPCLLRLRAGKYQPSNGLDWDGSLPKDWVGFV